MMVQYRSHTLETLASMEEYLAQPPWIKDIFLEFRVSKRTWVKLEKQQKELRH